MPGRGQNTIAFFKIIWVILFIQVILFAVLFPQINKNSRDPRSYPYMTQLEDEIPQGGEFVLSINFQDKEKTSLGLVRHVSDGTEIRVMNGQFLQTYQNYVDHFLFHLGLSGVDVDADSLDEMVLAEFFKDGQVVDAHSANFDSVLIYYHDPDTNLVLFDKLLHPGSSANHWGPRVTPLLKLDSVTPVENSDYFAMVYVAGYKYPDQKYVRIYKKSDKPELHAEIQTIVAPQWCDVYSTPDGVSHFVIGGVITGEDVTQKVSFELPDGRKVQDELRANYSVVTQYDQDGKLEWATQIKRGVGNLYIHVPEDSVQPILALHESTEFYKEIQSAQTRVFLNRSNGAVIDSVTRKGNFTRFTGLAANETQYIGIFNENDGNCFLLNNNGSLEEWLKNYNYKIKPFVPLAKVKNEFVVPLNEGDDLTLFYNLKGKKIALSEKSFWCKPFSNPINQNESNDIFCLRNENIFQLYSLHKTPIYISAMYNYKWILIIVLCVPLLTLGLYWAARWQTNNEGIKDDEEEKIKDYEKKLLEKINENERSNRSFRPELKALAEYLGEIVAQKEFLESVFNEISMPLAIIDQDFMFTKVNKAFASLYKSDAIRLKGSKFLADQRGGIRGQLVEIFNNGRATLNNPVEIRNNGEEKIKVEIEAVLIQGYNGKAKNLLLMFNDVTTLYFDESVKPGIRSEYGKIIGRSEKMQSVYDMIEKYKNIHNTILIRGETGSGKELVAHALHDLSDDKDKNFVTVNCPGVTGTLFESEFFGSIKGAFTDAKEDREGYLARADGGTLFLDEIGDLSQDGQAALLRTLENFEYMPVGSNEVRKFNSRIVMATRKNLENMVRDGSFRKDLYYRIRALQIKLPPLHERKDDIHLLAFHFMEKLNTELNKKINSIDRNAVEMLESFGWDGNVRELQAAMRSAMLNCTGSTLYKRDFEDFLEQMEEMSETEEKNEKPVPSIFDEKMSDFERSNKPLKNKTNDEDADLDKKLRKIDNVPGDIKLFIQKSSKNKDDDEKELEKKILLVALNHYNWVNAPVGRYFGITGMTIGRRIREYQLVRNNN